MELSEKLQHLAALNILRIECHGNTDPCLKVTFIQDGELRVLPCQKTEGAFLNPDLRDAMTWDKDFGWLISLPNSEAF